MIINDCSFYIDYDKSGYYVGFPCTVASTSDIDSISWVSELSRRPDYVIKSFGEQSEGALPFGAIIQDISACESEDGIIIDGHRMDVLKKDEYEDLVAFGEEDVSDCAVFDDEDIPVHNISKGIYTSIWDTTAKVKSDIEIEWIFAGGIAGRIRGFGERWFIGCDNDEELEVLSEEYVEIGEKNSILFTAMPECEYEDFGKNDLEYYDRYGNGIIVY